MTVKLTIPTTTKAGGRKTKRFTATNVKLDTKGEGTGTFTCKLASFGVVDHDGDYTLDTAFDHMDGVDILVSAWGHKHGELNAGRGTLRVVRGDGLYLDGQFYLQTDHGKNTYETVKANGELQEYSYGYDVDAQGPGEVNGERVNILVKVTPYEGCPVLRAAGLGTGTVDIKSEGDACEACGQALPDAAKANEGDGNDACDTCGDSIAECSCKDAAEAAADAKGRTIDALLQFEMTRAKAFGVHVD